MHVFLSELNLHLCLRGLGFRWLGCCLLLAALAKLANGRLAWKPSRMFMLSSVFSDVC